MAWSGTGADTEGVFRHPLNVMTRLSQRTPLRIKLIAALLTLVALALTVIGFTSIVAFRGYLLNQADSQVQTLVVQSANGAPPSPHQSDSYTFLGFDYEVIDSQGNLVSYYGNGQTLGPSGPDVPANPSWLSAHTGHPVTVTALAGSGQWRIIEQPVGYQQQDGSQTMGTLVIGENLGNINHTIGHLTSLDVIVSLVIMLGLGVVSVAVVRTNLRPLDDIEETAEEIAAGHLDRRVPDRDPRTEVGRLGRSINTMLAQIETAFHDREESEEAAVQSEERMRRFIADASHELRTPLTAIRGFAEYYRQRGGVATGEGGAGHGGTGQGTGGQGRAGSLNPEDLDRIMQRVESEAARMGVLVEDLLLLARLDQQRPIEHRPVDLLVLAADAVQDTRMIAPDRPVQLTVQPGCAFLVLGDEARLRQVIGNLMTNALTHTPDGTAVDVRLGAGLLTGTPPFPGAPVPSVPAAVLEIADHGPGLTPEQARRVFERFYRADQAIVSALVAAHGGVATVDSAPGQGATFRVTLPLAPDSGEADEPGVEPQDDLASHPSVSR
jgi:two-component system OmpR family sensor kinase